jgi:hypothetical protein
VSLLLLFSNDKWTALTGEACTSAHGRIRADWHIEGQQGDLASQVASTIALAGLSSVAATGTMAPEGLPGLTGVSSTTAPGDVGVARTGALLGAAANSAAGDLDNESASALLGALVALESGTLSAGSGDLSAALSGEACSGSTGTLTASGGSTDDLIELQRQRRFGVQYRTLVRTTHRRTVR